MMPIGSNLDEEASKEFSERKESFRIRGNHPTTSDLVCPIFVVRGSHQPQGLLGPTSASALRRLGAH